MSRLLRTALVLVLAGLLAGGPALAAPRSLGSILVAENARLGTASAVAGSTVYAGDQLITAAKGSMRLRVGGSQIYLLENSAVALEESSTGVAAQLMRGAVGFNSIEEAPVAVRAGEALIRAKSSQPTHGQVQMIGPQELLVSSYRGALEVVVGTEVHAVPEATTYRVVLEFPPQEPAGAGAPQYKRARVMMIFVGAAIAATVITFVILQNLSPSRP